VGRPRLLAVAAGVAASVAVMVGSIGWFTGHDTDRSGGRVILEASLHQGSRTVGEVYAYRGNPEWLYMTVRAAGGTGKVTCELIEKNGTLTTLGSFDLVGGSGSWGAPDRTGLTGVVGAQLVASDGRLVATATFPT
jgi:hypothetical protein